MATSVHLTDSLIKNTLPPEGNKPFENEVYIDRDIIVLTNPEIANLLNRVIALITAVGLATVLSTAAGLLLVIISSVSHDLPGRVMFHDTGYRQIKTK